MNNIVDLEFDDFDLGLITIREYFYELLSTLWKENESFNSKRPFGNSAWGCSLIECLVTNNLITSNASNQEIDEFIDDNILKVLFTIDKKVESKHSREIINCTHEEIAAILDWNSVYDSEDYFDENNQSIEGLWTDFEEIDIDDSDFYLEDSSINRQVIVRRISDGKYFKGNYTIFCNYNSEYDDLKLTEVTPIKKTIIVYE